MNRIFLSYGREDVQAVEQLYQRLEQSGLRPWMDTEALSPGAEWRDSILEEIKGADFFLACFSSQVLDKSSYRQREVREALEIAKLKPFGAIYLIPVKLDACELPTPLQPYHWVNYYEPEGWSKLVKTLFDEMEERAKRLPDFTAAQPPGTASEDKIRDRIRAILQRPRLQALRHALSQQHGDAQADILLPPEAPLMQAISNLYRAMQHCLAELAESRPDLMEPATTGAAEILGLLVLLAVQQERASRIPLDPVAGGLEIAIPLATEAGAEVLLSWRHDRAATFELRFHERYGERPEGLGGLGSFGLEHGIGSRDPLNDILAGVWMQVKRADKPPPNFDEPHLQMLRAAISTLRDFDNIVCYVTVPPAHSHSPLSDANLQRRLSAALPDLRIIRLTGAQGESILVLDEYTLENAIARFLIMLRDT